MDVKWRSGIASCVAVLQGHRDSIAALAKLGGALLASGSYDNNLKVWNVETGECVWTFEGHEDSVDEYTSKLWDGILAVVDPKDSWARKWVRLGKTIVPGCYAMRCGDPWID